MIIQCPDCGFSGRVPESALGVPHRATCPKCRRRFIPRASLIAAGLCDRRPFSSVVEADLAAENPESSSYELRAMTEDGGTAEEPARAHSLPAMGGCADHRPGAEVTDRAGPTASEPTDVTLPAVGTSSPASLEFTIAPPGAGPWYARVLQVWGIVLLIWAALILARYLLRTNLTGEGSPGNGQLLSTVIAVLLLVAGAAGLFVAVDFGESLRAGLWTPATCPASSKAALPRARGLRLGWSWHRSLRKPEPIRS